MRNLLLVPILLVSMCAGVQLPDPDVRAADFSSCETPYVVHGSNSCSSDADCRQAEESFRQSWEGFPDVFSSSRPLENYKCLFIGTSQECRVVECVDDNQCSEGEVCDLKQDTNIVWDASLQSWVRPDIHPKYTCRPRELSCSSDEDCGGRHCDQQGYDNPDTCIKSEGKYTCVECTEPEHCFGKFSETGFVDVSPSKDFIFVDSGFYNRVVCEKRRCLSALTGNVS